MACARQSKKGFFDWLNNEAPDVVCLQEIKARTEDLDENILNPEGYHAIWNPAERKGYSGVAIFTKKKQKPFTWEQGSNVLIAKDEL